MKRNLQTYVTILSVLSLVLIVILLRATQPEQQQEIPFNFIYYECQNEYYDGVTYCNRGDAIYDWKEINGEYHAVIPDNCVQAHDIVTGRFGMICEGLQQIKVTVR